MLSLDELRSPDFNLLSNQEYSEEELAETMVETMEQYMNKTRAEYESGVARPKIKNKDNFETTADAKLAIQEMAKYSQKWHNGTSKSRRWGYKAAALGFYQRNNVNPSYQERRKSMEDTLRKFMSESAKRHEENFNLMKEIQASIDATIRNQGASIKTLEIQNGQVSKVGFRSLPSSTEANPRDQVKSISTTIEADSCPIRRIGSA
nr:hypothetical protein [Tanacetum cinerariifolium]